ncbi:MULTISPECIES: phosphoribosylanthranilate isomerase [Aerococcus]|uniref:phosphoribosylanthranilate isomerase n=1 Tax=Aerococcus urinae (strain CCUG 59500 / ACS-120-V-Col10a) TaxID=2976812 RepID=UPI0002D3BDAB|nr:phosphoribosylanthranilate isomerase [Aerococcus sp. Group 1]MCY3030376.1 phosphoribosylanthranilate isomerase [Aerococcus sp. Group 1]MCY3054872.1 phosphoribosylanthranilate isomerase [Aerococcus sp. Group 1]MCY3056602.1 phosphoribosylanthranilate isomerase [Aerococcus sp. Group 1]MCY3061816.1 phosphoribosylanthranilate isomerase [Aerococcus sp. Group 1]
MKLKICGLKRPVDISYCNPLAIDYVGFIVDYPKSQRSVSLSTLEDLSQRVNPNIQKVGVFVNEKLDLIADLLKQGIIDIAQLHGQESPADIVYLQNTTAKPIWKAFAIQDTKDLDRAKASPADQILLDYKEAGSGKSFNWKLLKDFDRPFILAGGLNANNIKSAIDQVKPAALDLSTGVESQGHKDPNKIKEIVRMVKDV